MFLPRPVWARGGFSCNLQRIGEISRPSDPYSENTAAILAFDSRNTSEDVHMLRRGLRFNASIRNTE